MTSIIIPTYNAEKEIGGLLEALKSQTVSGEIMVMDSSSSDDTVSIARSHGATTLIIGKERFDHGGSRTEALRAAKGDVLVYLTQDVMPFDKYAVEYLLKPLEDAGTGAVFGRQLPQEDAGPFGAHLRLFNYPENSYIRGLQDKKIFGIKTPFLSNSFAAYRKKALEEIGGFRERLILGEDICAAAGLLLAGYKIAYAADARVYHSHNYTIFMEFKRYFDIGVLHKREGWILREFGKAEGEGMRYIRSGTAFLAKNGKYHLLPEFFLRGLLKYVGYDLGRNYERIPRSIIKKISMNSGWWDKCDGGNKRS